VVTNFVYDGLNPVQEKAGATVTANLLTGLGIDEFFTRTDGVGSRALLSDALGSTVALGDNTGTLQTQYTYEPFGYATQTGLASTNSYKYTGREDDGTGLYYYRARYYHPRLQRFLAEDPIRFSGGNVNLYGYVLNNPLSLIDALGLYTQQQLTAIIYNETAGLRGNQGDLYDSRVSIGHVAENRETPGRVDTGIASTSLSRNAIRAILNGVPAAVTAYAQSVIAASTVLGGRGCDPTGGAKHFILNYAQPLPRWAQGTPILSFGPFTNVGGGDVPRRSIVNIQFFP
jgi:RHS repeat-associated protein